MIHWTLKTYPLESLTEHPRNARLLTKDDAKHLKQSLKKFGLIDKLIINKDGQVIGGHQRLKVLRDLGYDEAECWEPDRLLNDNEVDELNIRLNRNTGQWDWDKLANEWNMADLYEWGFNDKDFDFEPVQMAPPEEESESLEPGKDEEAYTKPGDVYELGSHRLVCGDSTMPDTVAKCLNGAEPILMVTDPPYGVEYDASWRENAPGSVGKKWAKGKVQNDEKVNWSLAWHLFPGSVAYVWHAGRFAAEVQKSLEQSEYEIKSQIIWVKNHLVLSRGDYHWQHEPCWYAVKKGHKHNWHGDRKQTTTWQIANQNAFGNAKEEDERTAHSTQKPLECMARPIRNNSAAGEGVYDPFLGSGTTLIAAEQLGRVCYGIELSPAYCDIIVNRWQKYTGKKPVHNGIEIERIGNGKKARD